MKLIATRGRCAYCCTDKCERSDRMNAGSTSSVDVRPDLPIVDQHRLEDDVVTKKSTADLREGKLGIRWRNRDGTHDFVTTRFLAKVRLYLIGALEGLVEEWDFLMIGECRCNVCLSFVDAETLHIGQNVLCGPFCDCVPEGHDPSVGLGKH